MKSLITQSGLLGGLVKELDAVRDGLTVMRVRGIVIRTARPFRDFCDLIDPSTDYLWPSTGKGEEAREDPPKMAAEEPYRPHDQLGSNTRPSDFAFLAHLNHIALILKPVHNCHKVLTDILKGDSGAIYTVSRILSSPIVRKLIEHHVGKSLFPFKMDVV